MTSFRSLCLALAATLAMVPALFAAQLGDAAAPLQIATWVKGKPVDLAALKGKQIAVVEFWATWCGPCRTSIPHLTELQKQFKDVVFIGITDEDPDTVRKFVTQMGDKMDYTVAIDKDSKTGEGYMKAFGINGIPNAFVVDKEGRIVWQGHPMDHLDKVLTDVAAGKFDLKKAQLKGELQSKVQKYYELTMKDGDAATLDKLAGEIAALEKQIGNVPADEKFDATKIRQEASFQKAMRAYQTAVAQGASEEELEKLGKELQAVAPKSFDLAEFKSTMAAQKVFSEYFHALNEGADKEKIAGLAKQAGEVKTTNTRLLNAVAWTILTDERIQTRDYALALKLARAAVEASGEKESAVLDTYARALFESGNAAEAVTWQKKALALNKDDDRRKEFEDSLKKYQEKAGK